VNAAQSGGTQRASAGPVWRRLALALVVLVVLSLLASFAGTRVGEIVSLKGTERTGIDLVLAVVWLLVASLVVGSGRRRIAQERDARVADERRVWNMGVTLFAALGYAYVLLVALALLRINLSGILVAGGVTGIVIGIAAQSALGNMFGGMLVLLLHPYAAGQSIMVRSSTFGGVEYTGTVREVTLFYTVLDADTGRLIIPNSLAVASVVRVEATRDWQTTLVPIPYRIGVDRLAAALRSAGLPDTVHVEAYGPDTYSARVRLPAEGGDGALVNALQALLSPVP
jgi:small-conductance mechanosensitive channel